MFKRESKQERKNKMRWQGGKSRRQDREGKQGEERREARETEKIG